MITDERLPLIFVILQAAPLVFERLGAWVHRHAAHLFHAAWVGKVNKYLPLIGEPSFNLFFDGVDGEEPVNGDGLCLAHALYAGYGLGLGAWLELRLHENDYFRRLQVDAHSSRVDLKRKSREPFMIGEGVDDVLTFLGANASIDDGARDL